MANVEGWEVGKCYSEPLYKTVGPDEWVYPLRECFFAHAATKDLNFYPSIGLWY